MLTRLLTILPLLLCPLLMLACMWTMRNRGMPERQAGPQELPTAARIAQLERELAELRDRLPEASTAGRDAPAPAGPSVASGGRRAPAPPGLTGPR
jgi:hypothetical protein